MSSKQTWQQEAVAYHQTGLSWRTIAGLLGLPKSTVSDYLRKVFPRSPDPEDWGSISPGFMSPLARVDEGKEDNSRILVISDLHAPYQHPKALAFLGELKEKYKPTRVISIGDELDKHAMSFHDSDPDLDSAGKELERAKEVIAKLHKMFPRMDIIDSNHGSMLYRKAKHHGIPRQYLKSYNDVLGVGEGWKWHYDLTVTLPNGQPCYFHHGKSVNGLRLSQTQGMCVVQGHFHERFAIEWWANPIGLYFSMQVGCLIDDDSFAFAYNNVNLRRPIIGTGLIIDGRPVLEPMQL